MDDKDQALESKDVVTKSDEPEVEGHMIATDVVIGPEQAGSHGVVTDPSHIGKSGSPEDAAL